MDSVIIWNISTNSILRHFQRQVGGGANGQPGNVAGFYGIMGATASSGGPSENNEQRDGVYDMTWSNDS